MKFNCLTVQEKLRHYKNVHLWLAWYPVRVHHSDECILLEYVVRSYPKACEDASTYYNCVIYDNPKYECLHEWLFRNPNKMKYNVNLD